MDTRRYTKLRPGSALSRKRACHDDASVQQGQVDNPGALLKRQMYVRVQIRSRDQSTGLLVPVGEAAGRLWDAVAAWAVAKDRLQSALLGIIAGAVRPL